MAELLKEVLSDASVLSQHTYGNFVVRHCLEFGLPWHRRWLAASLCSNALEIARNQNGSRVIETALEFCDEVDKQMIIAALIADPKQLESLAVDSFGRHVVTALLTTPGEWQRQVVDALRPGIKSVRESSRGKPVVKAFEALCSQKE